MSDNCTFKRPIKGLQGEFYCWQSQHEGNIHVFRISNADIQRIEAIATKAAIYDAEQDFKQVCHDAMLGKRGPLLPDEIEAFIARGVSMDPDIPVKIAKMKKKAARA